MFCGIFCWLWYDLLMLFTCFVMFLCGFWRFRIKYSWMLRGKEWTCFLQDTYEVRGWSLKLATGSSTDISICAWLTLSISWLTRAYFCLNGNVFVPPWLAASFHCFPPSLDQAALLQFWSLGINSENLVELDAKHYLSKFIFLVITATVCPQ